MTFQHSPAHSPTAGFNTFMGFEILEWEQGRASVALDIRPEMMNSHGIVHGGVLATFMDYLMSLPGLKVEPGAPRLACVTINLTTNFVSAAKPGRLVGVSRLSGGGRSTYFAQGEIHDADGALVATGSGAFRRIVPRTPAAGAPTRKE